VKAACEFEFFVFEETPQSIRDKGLSAPQADHAGQFRLFDAPLGVHSDFYQELWSTCEEMRIELEGLHTETGPGVLEAAIRVDDALEAADKAALFKTILKILCQRRGWMATFMAKWSRDWPGQSGHLIHRCWIRNPETRSFTIPTTSSICRSGCAGMSAASRR
jgi:glutamine synthetase